MRRSVLFALAVIALSACATAPRPAPDGQTRPPFPMTETRAAFGLAHVDVETTGLDPDYHEMIDAGLIYTDLDGREAPIAHGPLVVGSTAMHGWLLAQLTLATGGS